MHATMRPTTLLHVLVLGLSSNFVSGDVVVAISNVEPLPLKTAGQAATALEILMQSCPEEIQPGSSGSNATVIVASYVNEPHDLAILNGKLYASSDSLVRGTIDTWAQHQNLVLRPHVSGLRYWGSSNYT